MFVGQQSSSADVSGQHWVFAGQHPDAELSGQQVVLTGQHWESEFPGQHWVLAGQQMFIEPFGQQRGRLSAQHPAKPGASTPPGQHTVSAKQQPR